MSYRNNIKTTTTTSAYEDVHSTMKNAIKIIIRTVEARAEARRKYVNRQQLPHLWWWLIIMATNLFSLCSITQAINSNGSSKSVLRIAKPILQATHTPTTSHNTTAVTTTSTTNDTTNAFDTEIHVHFETTHQLRGSGEIEEIENKPAEMNEHAYDEYVSKNRNELRGKFASTNNIRSDQTGSSGNVFTTTATLSFNHSDRSLFTFHDECLANSNTLSHICTIVLYSVVCVVGLFGNTLVIWVVLRFSKMQTVTNIYILNLAIADECFLIGIPFLLYTMRICSWKFGDYMCKAYMVSTSITQFTSSIFLLIMAADRYIAVCHPIESPKYRTLRIAKLVSVVAWITSAILMLPVILFANTVRQEDGINFSCNIDWPEVYKKHSGTTFILYTFLLGFATPLCFILVFYYLVIRKLRSVQQKHKSKEKKRSHRKVTRLVLTVITVYILCWLPHWTSQVSLISAFVGQRELSRFEILLFLLFGCLAYSNSAMNPILYAFLSDNFRKSFSRAFTCMNRQEAEAQLINEHSIFTHRRTGSGCKRKNSRHLAVPKTGGQHMQNSSSFLAPTTVHKSGGGGGGGGGGRGDGCSVVGGSSSGGTSTSTATTATDKSSNITKQTYERSNGDVVLHANTDEERIGMVVNQDHHMSHGFKTALFQMEAQHQTEV